LPAKDPAQRPASASELAHRLSRYAERLADITDEAASDVWPGEVPQSLAAVRAQRELERLELVLSDTLGSDPAEAGRIAA
jgi:hypothetical protein